MSTSPITGDSSFVDAGWLAAGDVAPRQRRAAQRARRAQAHESALARVSRTYAAARATVGFGLVAVQGLVSLLGAPGAMWALLVSVVYAVEAITLWLLPRYGQLVAPLVQAHPRWQLWLATIGADLLAFGALYAIARGTNFNYAALLVLPVLMAGALTARVLALGTAAAAALLLLAVAWNTSAVDDAAPLVLQSGLAGLGLFMIALLAGELAQRLAGEEVAARAGRDRARRQAELNRLVIQEMADGVLVVDRQLEVRAANPAARALLVSQGLSPPAPFSLRGPVAWSGLHHAVETALSGADWPESGRDVLLAFDDGHTRTLRLRVRSMRADALPGATPAAGDDGAGEPYAVVLLEDLRTLEARIRQEKLAAMGRVSAGIAHEIRNPLAAIAQANSLLLEDALAPPQQRLATIVAANVERLRRLVDDVVDVAPGYAPAPHPIDAAQSVAQVVAEWMQAAGARPGGDAKLRTELPDTALPVHFDAEHLRRVLVNLLDNADRHASAAPGAVFVRLAARDDDNATLSVMSDGAPIAPEVERFLFEPFFSSRSRGSGLGLYICRELCERYGASIAYRPRPSADRLRNEFLVVLRRAAADDAVPSR